MATPTPKFMTAVDIKNGTGPATSLFLNPSVPIPVPGPGEALIKIHAFGLNRMDLLQREGHYPIPPSAPPTLGVEFSGTILTTNPPSHASFPPGLPVFGLAPGGAYAQYLVAPTALLIPKPPHLSFAQAAAVPETWMTATQALHFVLELRAGQTVLWHAGASGVSIAGAQLSKAAGAGAVYATVGSEEKVGFVEGELGVTRGVNYKTGDWVKEVMEATGGRGVDCVVDFVGGEYFGKNLEVLARDGRVVVLGLMGGRVAERVDVGMLLMKRARVEGSTLRSRGVEYQAKLRERLEREALPRLETGEFKVFVERVLPWQEIVQAHQLMESNQTKGKIVCTVD
ncbi:zinc-binding dehydrogenase [Podospora conica]|nr:zinc-binding dehydrogenase [Schizothecium conicum]